MEMICINNSNFENRLTIGKSYKIIGGTFPNLVLLYDDNINPTSIFVVLI